jgi:hypothetical protein
MGKRLKGTGCSRAQCAADTAALDTTVDGLAIEKTVNDARVERVASTRGIDRLDARGRHAAQAARIGDPRTIGTMFKDSATDTCNGRPRFVR